jgi:mRNA-degrading endonuclease toxin of MazEF toxin-antitoxin module
MNQGDIFWADTDGGRRPVIIISRATLNRGDYVLAVPCTTAHLDVRRRLPNCIAIERGEFGIPRACVAQAEALTMLHRTMLVAESGTIGTLDAQRLRSLIRAVGYVIDAECGPL